MTKTLFLPRLVFTPRHVFHGFIQSMWYHDGDLLRFLTHRSRPFLLWLWCRPNDLSFFIKERFRGSCRKHLVMIMVSKVVAASPGNDWAPPKSNAEISIYYDSPRLRHEFRDLRALRDVVEPGWRDQAGQCRQHDRQGNG